MSHIEVTGDPGTATFVLPKATVLGLAKAVRGGDVICVSIRVGYVDSDTVIMADVISEDMRGERSTRRMVATANGVFDL